MAAGAENKIVFLDILFDSGASQMAKTFAVSLACFFRVGVLIENADAKAEDATLREKMSRAKRRDFSRSGEASEGTAEFTFLVTSLLNDKEVASKSAQISARHGVRIFTGRILHTKFFSSG